LNKITDVHELFKDVEREAIKLAKQNQEEPPKDILPFKDFTEFQRYLYNKQIQRFEELSKRMQIESKRMDTSVGKKLDELNL